MTRHIRRLIVNCKRGSQYDRLIDWAKFLGLDWDHGFTPGEMWFWQAPIV